MASDFLAAMSIMPRRLCHRRCAAFMLDAEIRIQLLLGCLSASAAAQRHASWPSRRLDPGSGGEPARTLAGCRIARRTRHLLIGREPGRIARAGSIAAGQACSGTTALRSTLAATDRACTIVPVRLLKLAAPTRNSGLRPGRPARHHGRGRNRRNSRPWSCRTRGDTQLAGSRRFSENWPLTCSRMPLRLASRSGIPMLVNGLGGKLSRSRTCPPLREEQREQFPQFRRLDRHRAPALRSVQPVPGPGLAFEQHESIIRNSSTRSNAGEVRTVTITDAGMGPSYMTGKLTDGKTSRPMRPSTPISSRR